MQLMEIRRMALGASLEGLQRGGGPYVGYLKEPVEFYPAGYFPVGHADDHGTFFAIPKIAYAFNLPIESAVNAFYYSVIGLSVIVGILGCSIYFRSWAARFVAAAWLIGFAATTATYADVYLISPCVVIASVPWVLWTAQRPFRPSVLLGIGVLLGLVVAVSNLMRAHTGTAVLLLAIPSIGLATQFSRRLRLGFFTLAAIAFGCVNLYQAHLMRQADAFVQEHSPENISSRTSSHLFWHSIYIGLGFLRNSHGIEYKDTIAMKLAERLAPEAEYLSRDYDAVIRNQFIDLYRRDPMFVWQAWFAKSGVVLLMYLVHANAGLLAVWFSALPWRVLMGLFAATAFSALPGILVMPYEVYLLGMWAWATLLAILSIGSVLDRWNANELRLPFYSTRRHGGIAPAYRWTVPALRSAIVVVAAWWIFDHAAALSRTISTEIAATNDRQRRLQLDRLVAEGLLDVAQSKQLQYGDWQPSSKQVTVTTESGIVKLTTDHAQFGYQLETPLTLVGNGTVFIDYEIAVESGGVLIGILNEAGQWVETAPCVGAQVHRGRIGSYTPNDRLIRIVIANNGDAGSTSSQCRLTQVTVNEYAGAISAQTATAASRKDSLPR